MQAVTKTVLCYGATGDVGGRAVYHLLQQGHSVRAVVRSEARLPERVKGHAKLECVEVADVTALGAKGTEELMKGCDAVVQCLGHRMTFEGMYKHPRRLCADVVSNVVGAAKLRKQNNPDSKPLQYVLLSTAGASKPDNSEKPRGWGEWAVLSLLEYVLPPHYDNILALRRLFAAKEAPGLEWVAVRPDDFEREKGVSPYKAFDVLQNGLFNPGTTSTENIGHFFAALVTDDALWAQWRGKSPQLLNVPDGTAAGNANNAE